MIQSRRTLQARYLHSADHQDDLVCQSHQSAYLKTRKRHLSDGRLRRDRMVQHQRHRLPAAEPIRKEHARHLLQSLMPTMVCALEAQALAVLHPAATARSLHFRLSLSQRDRALGLCLTRTAKALTVQHQVIAIRLALPDLIGMRETIMQDKLVCVKYNQLPRSDTTREEPHRQSNAGEEGRRI